MPRVQPERRAEEAGGGMGPQPHSRWIREANKVLLAGKQPGAAGRFFAPGYVAHLEGKRHAGIPSVKRYVAALARAFPDLAFEVEILTETADRVVWLRTCRGTHLGAWRGLRPTGLRTVWRDMVTSRFDGNLIAEEWLVTDIGGQLRKATDVRKSPISTRHFPG